MKYLFLLLFLFGCKQIVVGERTGGEYVWEPFCVVTGTMCGQEMVQVLWEREYPILNIENEMTRVNTYACRENETVWVKFCKAYKFPEGRVVGEVTQERLIFGEQYIATTYQSFFQLVIYFIQEGIIEVKSNWKRVENEDRS